MASLVSGARASAAPMAGTPLLEYSQDGTTFHAFDVATGRQRVKNYYDYHGLSGHPGFGTVREVATAALYWDSKRGALSLIDINGSARHGYREAVGDVSYDFSGLATSVYLNVADDPAEITYKKGAATASAHFQYKSSTDGLVLSGLEKKTFAIRVAMTAAHGVTRWRLLDGNLHAGGGFIDLDEDQPLYLRMSALPGGGTPSVPPVTGGSGGGGGVGTVPQTPEPGMIFTGALVLGLLSLRRRR